MSNTFIQKLLITIVIGTALIFLIFGLYVGHTFYNKIFRLSSSQISRSLINTQSKCTQLNDCTLLPGDILIRRYITSRTWVIDKLAHPYFTHSAFYLGNNQLVEAVGTENESQDDIQIDTLSKSDWLHFDVNNFVVIRPKHYSLKLDSIKNNLKKIAEDPEYTFGLPKKGYKRTTCADLIFKQLIDHGISSVSSEPQVITPDYLFFTAITNPDDFESVGYNIQKM